MNSRYDHRKYPAMPVLALPDREWPNRQIEVAPSWCSVDLRDGNQALIDPMTVEQKRRMFTLLVELGFKEIEVGFPAASQPDFDFVRELIENDAIPEDVTIQVLTQAREELIARSFEALRGARRAIVHLYNSTSVVQREQVFKMDRAGIRQIAVQGARWVQQYAQRQADTEWVFQYSPESFTGTEVDYAVEVCNAVIEVWQPVPERPVIINLPATVEMTTPNVYADQIEWVCRHIDRRDSVLISLHTHNDRGCAVAAAELGVMAGADRVEGTLLGNGERTGNMDIVTMAMNLYSRGIDPQLDLSDVDHIMQVVEHCTRLPVHPRHPYVGELVYTAFSGSHQDAINKCLSQYREGQSWEVAYLPIDPRDIGRSYEDVIRINSQSGKGGVAYLLAQNHGIEMPRWLQIDFSRRVQAEAESRAREVPPETIWELFQHHYLQGEGEYQLAGFNLQASDQDILHATLLQQGQPVTVQATAGGVLEAFVRAMSEHCGMAIDILDYHEHALGQGSGGQAVAYIHLKCGDQRSVGVAVSEDIVAASLRAVLSAVNAVAGKRASDAA